MYQETQVLKILNDKELLLERDKVINEYNAAKAESPEKMVKWKELLAVEQELGFRASGLRKIPTENTPIGAEYNPISKPQHYNQYKNHEPRKVIEDWELNFNLGNALKYISRYKYKGTPKQDLEKAIQYLKFELEKFPE